MQQRKHIIRFLGFALLIIVPISLSIAIRKQLGEDAYLRAVKEMDYFFSRSGFWVKEYDLTFFLVTVADVRKLFLLHSLICSWGGAILVCDAIEQKNRNMYPLVIFYSILAFVSLNAFLSEISFLVSPGFYNQLSRLAFNIHVLRGVGAYVIYICIILSYLYFVASELKQQKTTTALTENRNRI